MSIVFNEKDKGALATRFRDNFNQYGYSQAALDWNKGKQDIRFDILTSFFDVKNKSVVDIGCGFGDLLRA